MLLILLTTLVLFLVSNLGPILSLQLLMVDATNLLLAHNATLLLVNLTGWPLIILEISESEMTTMTEGGDSSQGRGENKIFWVFPLFFLLLFFFFFLCFVFVVFVFSIFFFFFFVSSLSDKTNIWNLLLCFFHFQSLGRKKKMYRYVYFPYSTIITKR